MFLGSMGRYFRVKKNDLDDLQEGAIITSFFTWKHETLNPKPYINPKNTNKQRVRGSQVAIGERPLDHPNVQHELYTGNFHPKIRFLLTT